MVNAEDVFKGGQMKKIQDLTGQKFGRLTVLERAPNYITPKGRQRSNWKCQCECGKIITVIGTHLRNGNTKSCGCLQKEKAKQLLKDYHKYPNTNYKLINKKYNKYDLSGEYGIGYTSNTNTEGINYFYFDLEDYDKIKKYCWSFAYPRNYLEANNFEEENSNNIKLHRLITNCPSNKQIDHINHKKYDNRKSNLREVDNTQNQWNKKGNRDIKNQKYIGVTKRGEKFRAIINCNKHRYYLGTFKTFEEAVNARIKAEEKYFGEYRYRECTEETF